MPWQDFYHKQGSLKIKYSLIDLFTLLLLDTKRLPWVVIHVIRPSFHYLFPDKVYTCIKSYFCVMGNADNGEKSNSELLLGDEYSR